MRETTKEGYTPTEAEGDVEQIGADREVHSPATKQPASTAEIVGTLPADAGQFDELRGSLKKPYGARPCKK